MQLLATVTEVRPVPGVPAGLRAALALLREERSPPRADDQEPRAHGASAGSSAPVAERAASPG